MTKMKDSGFEWIGEIPESWSIQPISKMFKQRNTKVSDFDYAPLSVTKQGIVPQLDSAAKSDDHTNRKRVKKFDFVINSRSDRKMSSGVSQLDGSVSLINIVMKYDHTELYPAFVNYLMKNYGFAEEFYRWGTGIVADLWSTNWERSKKIQIPVPALEEQQAIADFLDEKVAKIDEIIADTKLSIEKLKDYKHSIITEAVTKGIEPESELMDSNVTWMGKVPSSWKKFMIGQLFEQVKEKNEGMIENNLLSLSYGKIKRRSIESSDGLLPSSFEGYNIIEKDDIVLRMTDLQNDHKSLRQGISTERGIVTSAYITMRAKQIIEPRFVYYQLFGFDINKGYYGMGSGVRQGVNWNDIKKLPLLLPNVAQQKVIVDYLDEKSNQIETLISEKDSLISKYEDYKKSMIYEYVTGKKQVL
ncbi:TPA: restriction endonuclease subunit S [Streptococcus suis]|nr:restriction endonuclease subunit S [Streptococcus suis]HEM3723944.1 restriction endonuclease subunit S [Streptococcus suis]